MYDIQQILRILPHRYPFLLVDRIEEVQGNTIAVGIKNVTMNEPFFQGHFPGKPVMPGVLVLEAMAQVGGVLLLSQSGNEGRLAYFAGMDKVKFRRMIVPGDTLRTTVEVIKIIPMGGKVFGKVRASAEVDGEPAAEAEFTFTLGDAQDSITANELAANGNSESPVATRREEVKDAIAVG
jgi:3-hydroxyacyl-[acyl-carrier-protein] dehydratase